jgi:ribosomal protein S18 acetylase RimI-like enzyme
LTTAGDPPLLVIRAARPGEYAAVDRLTVRAYREYAGSISPEMWAAYEADLAGSEARAREAVILVAELAGELVGAVAYFPPGDRESRWFPEDSGYFRVLAVLPEHRGQGIGHRLTEACVQRARADGARAVGLMTTELMMVAKEMYEGMGFVQQAEYDGPMGGRFWLYSLSLEKAGGGVG